MQTFGLDHVLMSGDVAHVISTGPRVVNTGSGKMLFTRYQAIYQIAKLKKEEID